MMPPPRNGGIGGRPMPPHGPVSDSTRPKPAPAPKPVSSTPQKPTPTAQQQSNKPDTVKLKQTYDVLAWDGLSYQNHFNFEMNFMYGTNPKDCNAKNYDKVKNWLFKYVGAGAEFYYAPVTVYWAPKVTVEGIWHFVGMRMNVENYFGDKRSDLRFVPEIGITKPFIKYSPSYLSLFFGYNLHIAEGTIGNIPGYRITIYITGAE